MFLRAERDRERCARRNVASILDAARKLGIRDAQANSRNRLPKPSRDGGHAAIPTARWSSTATASRRDRADIPHRPERRAVAAQAAAGPGAGLHRGRPWGVRPVPPLR